MYIEPWQRNQYALVLSTVVAFIGFMFVLPFLPLYVQELGVTDLSQVALWSGLLFGISPFLAAVMAPVWGTLGDRFGMKLMVVRALGSFVIIMVLLGFVSNVLQLLSLRMALGLLGGFGALSLALATSGCPQDRVSEAVGQMQAARLLSSAVGPALGGFLADAVGIRRSFFVTSAMCAVALVVVVFFYREEPRRRDNPDRGSSQPKVSLRDVMKLPGFVPILVVLFLVQFIERSFDPLLPLYVGVLGTPSQSVASTSGLIISLGAGASALSAIVVGRLGGRQSPTRLLVLSLMGGVIACLPIALAQATWQLMVFRAVLGLLAGGSLTLAYTIGGLTIPDEGRGAGFGFLSSGAMIGGAISPLTSGALATLSLRGVFAVDAGLYALLAVWAVATLVYRRRRGCSGM